MTATLQRSAWALCLILITALFTGCASTVGVSGDKQVGFAYIDIVGADEALIKAAAIEVFTQDENFKVISEAGNQVRFTKDGTTSTKVFYGTTFNTDKMTIEPELSITTISGGTKRLHCEVYIMEHLNNGETKPGGWRLIKNGRRAYMKLLKEVKALAEGE
jgi:hypothetical protein